MLYKNILEFLSERKNLIMNISRISVYSPSFGIIQKENKKKILEFAVINDGITKEKAEGLYKSQRGDKDCEIVLTQDLPEYLSDEREMTEIFPYAVTLYGISYPVKVIDVAETLEGARGLAAANHHTIRHERQLKEKARRENFS